MKGLTYLNLSFNNIGDAGARAIAGSIHMKSLTLLILFGNNIGVNGAVAIAESQFLAKARAAGGIKL